MSGQKKLRVGLFAFGTDGDIQPLIELALNLFRRGHSIELAIICLRNRDYSHLQNQDFNVHVIPYPKTNAMDEFSNKEFWNFSDTELSRYFDTQFNVVRNTIRRLANLLAKRVDLLISIRLMYPVRFSAEQQGIPYVCLHFAHSFIKSRHYPPFGSDDLGPDKNMAAWLATDSYTNQALLPGFNKFREFYTLEPCTDFYTQVHHSSELNLVAFSRHLLPHDLDWEKNFHLCGYFNRGDESPLSASDVAIHEFIDQGSNVVGVTFGSLLEYESAPAEFLNKIAQAFRAQRARAVILTNKDYGLVSDEYVLFATGYINHRALFRRCSFVVHHGGAGTTHVVAACGVPSLLVPYGFDQFSIGALLIKLGVCHGIMSRKDFTVEEFSQLLKKALLNPSLDDRAKQLGNHMSTDQGIKRAADLIEEKYA